MSRRFTYEDLTKLGYTFTNSNVASKLHHKPQQDKRTKLLGAQEAQRQGTGNSPWMGFKPPRVCLTLERYACRPQDPDNCAASCKALIDSLRHEGILFDDNPDCIELVVRSLKVHKRKEERVEITLSIIN